MLLLRLRMRQILDLDNQHDPELPECERMCLVGGGQTLIPRKRACFPYLTTAEHASPRLQAALFHGPGARVHCFTRGVVQYYLCSCSFSAPPMCQHCMFHLYLFSS